MAEIKKPPVRMMRKGYEYVRLPLSELEGTKAHITIDPNIQFGSPCLSGTRLPAESMAGYYFAGDSLETIMKNFNITEAQVLACIEYIDGKQYEPS